MCKLQNTRLFGRAHRFPRGAGITTPGHSYWIQGPMPVRISSCCKGYTQITVIAKLLYGNLYVGGDALEQPTESLSFCCSKQGQTLLAMCHFDTWNITRISTTGQSHMETPGMHSRHEHAGLSATCIVLFGSSDLGRLSKKNPNFVLNLTSTSKMGSRGMVSFVFGKNGKSDNKYCRF